MQKGKNRSLSPIPKTTTVEIRHPKGDDVFNNKFYNRFYKQQMTYNMLQKQIEKEIYLLANSKKITEGSYRIIVKKLETRIASAVSQCKFESLKHITFQQMGRLLVVLGVFDVLEFDDNCNCNHLLSLVFECSRLGNSLNRPMMISDERRYLPKSQNQMNLHDGIWDLLSRNDEAETIELDCLVTVLRILMDPVKLGVHDTGELLFDCLHSRYGVKEDHKQGIQKVITLFRSVTQHRRLETTPQKREERARQIKEQQDAELSFKPKLNPTSVLIDKKHVQRIVSEQSSQLSQALFGDESHVSGAKITRVELLLRKKEEQELKRQEMEKEKQRAELRECTFHPLTNNLSTDDSTYSTSTDRERQMVMRLYPQDEVQNRRQLIEEMDRLRQEERLQAELEQHCSFRPRINEGILYDPQPTTPKDYDRTVGRLRFAQEQNQKKRELQEYIPSGQGYEKARQKAFNPPQMVERQKTKRKPLLIMDINVAPGRQGRIALYPNDDPYHVASNFAKMFSLNRQMEETVLNVLLQQMAQNHQCQ